MSDAFFKYQENTKLYVAVHSYGPLLIYPYSYDFVLPDNSDELQTLAEDVAKVIKAVNGKRLWLTITVYFGKVKIIYVAILDQTLKKLHI